MKPRCRFLKEYSIHGLLFHLANIVVQQNHHNYEGIYNFYNIGANSGEDPIGNGLKYASNKTIGKYLLPWNDPVKAIKGGAIWIATNYIAVGQDTLYFQKYDVVSNGTALYNHQYMQNIFAARSEGYTTYSTYNKLKLLDCYKYPINF